MYNKLLITIILIILLITTCIAISKPAMHKTFIIYNSEYELVTEKQEKKQSTEIHKNIPKQTTTTKKETPIVKTTQQTKTVKKINKQETKSTKKSIPKTETVKIKQEQTIKEETPKQQEIKKAETENIKKTESEKKTYDVDSESSIEWNKWRSDLQNRIMSDVKLPQIQEGIIFKFSFDVDKYGKITDVQTWSTTAVYTPYAIQYIAPVIKSYQGKDFLNFPQGSSRYITTVTGAWKISQTLKFSTPKDFKDVEKIRKQ